MTDDDDDCDDYSRKHYENVKIQKKKDIIKTKFIKLSPL